MAPESNKPVSTRRDFLAQAGTAVAVAALSGTDALADADKPAAVGTAFEPVTIPEWVYGITRMAFVTPGDVTKAAKAGAQVIHTNLIWPYFPLHRDGGGLSKEDDKAMKALVADCRGNGVKLVLGLPPFPSVALVTKHPEWRVHADDSNAAAKVAPQENNLGTRFGCNLGPWGDYLIDICAELIADYGLDGYSFDGNYHAALCFCPACKEAYKQDRKRTLPAKINLDDVAYREYLVWRGERLEDHYRRLQQRIKKANANAVLISWTTNAGRYGHFLHSPRPMPARMNLLFDLPMQEWWFDETNVGGSLAPAFGAAYLKAVTGGRLCASEPYLMSRGNPYGTDSFPAHERLTRVLLATTSGSSLALSFGWSGHEDGVTADFKEVLRRERYLTHATALPWAAQLVSDQTRQFYAYKDIADRWLPHVVGAFRAATEEHLPLTLINDWDLHATALVQYPVLVLPNAAALSDAQAEAVREYVRKGGGLVATGETSLCDEIGRPRGDFALADLFGVSYQGRPKAPLQQRGGPELPSTGPISYQGRPKAPLQRPMLDANFAVTLDESYWKQRAGVATLTWADHALLNDERLNRLVPRKSVTFRGPLVAVSEPKQADEAVVRMKPEGSDKTLPAVVVRRFGEGRVVYFAAAVDAALWSYAYPYQRRLFARALEWAARTEPSVAVVAPMCVQATYWTQTEKDGRRLIVHLFNGVNTAANHGLPAMDVPLREEVVPIHNIEVRFAKDAPKKFRCEPGGRAVEVRQEDGRTVVTLPPLEIHTMLVGEYE